MKNMKFPRNSLKILGKILQKFLKNIQIRTYPTVEFLWSAGDFIIQRMLHLLSPTF